MDNKSYRAYLKELGLKEEQPILINQFAAVDYSEGRIKVIQGKLLKSRDNWQINTCDNSKVRDYKIVENALKEVECYHTIKNIYETTKFPFGFSYLIESAQPIIIIPNGYINEIVDYYDNDEYREPSSIVLIKASKYTELDKKINAYIDEYKLDTLYYANIQEQTKMSRNIILIIKILFYGFISLVTLIGVTSVFNTINTSIALRRREFAVLRSMGLTPKGFNRLLQFETLIVGLKALFYALPVSLGIIYLINKSASDMVTFSDMMIPWKSIMFAVIGVFVIISITMWYATRRIKKENILDAIREENI